LIEHSTESLTLFDWLRGTAVASSVLWLREVEKAVSAMRRALLTDGRQKAFRPDV
jgi:hypothetical protein